MQHRFSVLVGRLGADPELKTTREREVIRTVAHELREETFKFVPHPFDARLVVTEPCVRVDRLDEVEVPYTVGGKTYARASLATHHRVGGRWVTQWHQLVVWDADRGDFRLLRMARKGDKVRVWGTEQRFTYQDETGEERELVRFVVARFEMVERRKVREVA